jgi:hypothetical protein
MSEKVSFKPLSSVQTFAVFKEEMPIAVAQVVNGEVNGVFTDRELTLEEELAIRDWAHDDKGFRISDTFCYLGTLTTKKRTEEKYG